LQLIDVVEPGIAPRGRKDFSSDLLWSWFWNLKGRSVRKRENQGRQQIDVEGSCQLDSTAKQIVRGSHLDTAPTYMRMDEKVFG